MGFGTGEIEVTLPLPSLSLLFSPLSASSARTQLFIRENIPFLIR